MKFEVPYISMVINRKTRKAQRADGKDAGDLTIEVRKKAAPASETAQNASTVRTFTEKELQEIKAAGIVATLKCPSFPFAFSYTLVILLFSWSVPFSSFPIYHDIYL